MYFADRTRYIVLTLSVICFTLIFANSVALNFTIICMDDNGSDSHLGTPMNSSHGSHWLHSSTHVNSLFSAIAIGCLIGTIPSTYIIHKLGLWNVSPTELQKITSDKQVQRKESIPYGAIIKDPCILAVWLAASGGNLGFQVFVLYGPTYINKVTNPTVDQIAYTAAIVFSGINVVGVVKCAQLVARQHAHFVMAVMSFHLCIIILFVPIAVSIVCPDNTPEQWSNLFFGISVIVVVANVPFAFLASSEPAPWTGNEITTILA
ncbi:hypothetical protein RB195_005510 [Necator americanus]|uniref:Uncharacterized protein n=1 Tax=Necator americanus TaxID=51031 RepID=A0ABR1BN71_NECAM